MNILVVITLLRVSTLVDSADGEGVRLGSVDPPEPLQSRRRLAVAMLFLILQFFTRVESFTNAIMHDVHYPVAILVHHL